MINVQSQWVLLLLKQNPESFKKAINKRTGNKVKSVTRKNFLKNIERFLTAENFMYFNVKFHNLIISSTHSKTNESS